MILGKDFCIFQGAQEASRPWIWLELRKRAWFSQEFSSKNPPMEASPPLLGNLWGLRARYRRAQRQEELGGLGESRSIALGEGDMAEVGVQPKYPIMAKTVFFLLFN